jgi:hypothetical protein
MSTRYLEFDSNYRNRKLYPDPSNFVIEISQSGQLSKTTAADPVSDSSPVLIWNNNFIQGTTPQNFISGITVSPVTSPSNTGNTIFKVTGTNLKQVRNFYVGAYLVRDSTGANPPVAPITSRRIIEYNPLNTSTAMITLECPLPDSLTGLTGFVIYNPTPLPTDTPNTLIKFYIPGSNDSLSVNQKTQNYGFGGDNYYINYYVMNTDTGTFRKIIGYDFVTRLATLDSPTPGGEDWSSNTYALSNFVIRKVIPLEYSTILSPSTILYASANMVQLQYNPNISTETYNGDFIRINPAVNAPSPYDITTTPPYNAGVPATNCQTEERKIQKYVYGYGSIQSVAGTTVNLGSAATNLSEVYEGMFITNLSAAVSPPPSFPYPTATIVSYNPITKVAVLSSPIFTAIGEQWLIRTCVVTPSFSIAPCVGNLYEIEQFTRDNFNPFVYTGSLVSSQEAVCYEVELLNLILPNFLLSSSRGGRAIFYPYLYVELQQISSSTTTNRNIIYSNNPNSYRMLFRAVVDDTPMPIISPFIKIDGDGMVHTIKFKPNDSFLFAVYHSNGELFKVALQDKFSPSATNPLAQISACFSFKRV